MYSPSAAVDMVRQNLTALPACIAGSAVSAETYNMPSNSFSDVDVFAYTKESLVACVQILLERDFTIPDRYSRVWHRWKAYGMNSWHTNSIKLFDQFGLEINIIHKSLNRNPLTSLSQVLESFDFGLLATGYDLTTNTYHDLRSFLFPGWDIDGPLPMKPQRRDAWRGGFISQYQGLRELSRYAKYATRGYDMSAVKDDLVEGYLSAATYLSQRSEQDKQLLSRIYYQAADTIIADDLDELALTGHKLVTLDSLDAIMEALE